MKLSNNISKQVSKLEELEIRLKLIEELITPYTLGNSTKTSFKQTYFVSDVLPAIIDGIGFIREDMTDVQYKLSSIASDQRQREGGK